MFVFKGHFRIVKIYMIKFNELLTKSGFWANHSTDACLSQLTDITLNGAEKGKHTGMIFIDLQKAFDILDKMTGIGFSH